MNRVVMWFLLSVVAAAAAVLSFSSLTSLAALCGFDAGLAWLLPVTIDAGAAAGCLVWLGRVEAHDATGYARGMTPALLASSVAGNATVHALTAYRVVPPWWLVVAVSAVPPIVLGAVVHLAVLVGRPDRSAAGSSRKETPSEVSFRRSNASAEAFDVRKAARCGEAFGPRTDLPPTRTEASEDSSGRPPGEPGDAGDQPGEPGERAGEDRAAVLIAEGAGRRRLAAELGISEHAARRPLAGRENGVATS